MTTFTTIAPTFNLVREDVLNLPQLFIEGGSASNCWHIIRFKVHLNIPANQQGQTQSNCFHAALNIEREVDLDSPPMVSVTCTTTTLGVMLISPHYCRVPDTYIPDIKGDGHKCIENHKVGEDLEEGQLSWVVLGCVKVGCVHRESNPVHKLKDKRPDQTHKDTTR